MNKAVSDNSFWEGSKVRLRAYLPEDGVAKYQEYIDTPARRNIQYRVELPETQEEYQSYFNGPSTILQENGSHRYAIESLDGQCVGWINMHPKPHNGTFELDLGIFRPHWRRGYAEEAIRLVLRYSFFELGYQKCNSACLSTNTGSLHLQRKIGFKEEGLRRRNIYQGGIYHDECLLGLTREEFEQG